MGAGKCGANTLLGVAATIFLLIGLGMIAGSVSVFFTFVKDLVSPFVAASGIGIGVAISLIALMGFMGICKRTNKKFWIGSFMLFDLIVLLALGTVVFFMIFTADAMKLARDQSFLNITSTQLTVAKSLIGGVEKISNGCGSQIYPLYEQVYEVNCSASSYMAVATLLNTGCFGSGHPVHLNETESIVSTCYRDGIPGWDLKVPYNSAYPVEMVNTPKGIFCQCTDTLTDFFLDYMVLCQIIGICVVAFFFIVFVACCYLCCTKDEAFEDDPGSELAYKGYLARP